MEWYLKVVRDNYANFEGRARRQEYWMFVLLNFIFTLLFYIPLIIGVVMESETIMYIGIGLMSIYVLAVFVPSLAVIVRRLHDQDKSGWYYFIAFIPIVGFIWMLVLLITEGTQGSNQYGEDPKAGEIS
jgi:uncharacterized membrane protein YhaH (DUF805 family)